MKNIQKQLIEATQENEALRQRLQEAEDTLSAIRRGEVDALVVDGPNGEQIFSLKGVDHSYRVLVEEMHEGAVTISEDGAIIYANKFMEKILDKPLEKVIGATIDQFMAPSDIASFRALLKQSSHGDVSAELKLKTSNGLIIPAYLSINRLPLHDEPFFCMTITDLTDQKRQERILAEERLSRSIIDQSAEAIVVCDDQGMVIRASSAAFDLIGRNCLMEQFDTVFALRICRTSPAQSADAADFEPFTISHVINGSNYRSCEACIGESGVHARHLLLSAAPLKDIENNVVGGVVNLTDISKQIAFERCLQEREEKYRQLYESIRDAYVQIDMAGNIRETNPAFQEMLGYTHEELICLTSKYLTPEQWHDFEAAIIQEEIIPAGSSRIYEKEYIRKDGTVFPVEHRFFLLQDHTHQPVAMWAIVRDITDRKQVEENLVIAKAQADAANRAKSEFLANMSHEIRTPMNGVIGMTGLLLDTELDDEQRRYAEIVCSSGNALLCLINDILDFSKIEAKKLDLEVLDFDLSRLLDDFADTLALRANENGLELLYAADLNVPTLLCGDPGRLRQILTNLTGNAIKFTHAGEVSVRVSLVEDNVKSETVMLRFSVRDTGIGIPAEKMDRLFKEFSQIDGSTTRQYGGSGLGLSISKQLAELMGGEAGVTSEEGKGSEFWFTARFNKQAVGAYKESIQPADLHGVRVLIVDDSATSREILTARMVSWGMRPTEVKDGPGALQSLYLALNENDPFCIAVIDMRMPDMDGETLGSVIRGDKRLSDTRMILLTSVGTRGDALRFQQIGFSAYTTKPIQHRELKVVLSLALAEQEGIEPKPIVTRHTAREKINLFVDRNVRILLAEDDITNQLVALGILKKLGLHADAVSNGSDALIALQAKHYDLVLMDVNMPVMDGFEATKRIRNYENIVTTNEENKMMNYLPSFSSIIPIIAMTAHAMKGDRELCLEAGMNDYITKPVSPQALVEVLEKWLPKNDNIP